MNRAFLKNKKRGVGLVEVVVGSAILSVVLFAFSSSLSLYSQANSDATRRSQALYLAEEALEVVRGLRDDGWSANIASRSVDTPYGLSFNAGTSSWSLVSGADTVGAFTRTVVFRDVYRDGDDNITSSTSETFDPDTRLVEVTLEWAGLRGPQSVELESIVTNTFE